MIAPFWGWPQYRSSYVFERDGDINSLFGVQMLLCKGQINDTYLSKLRLYILKNETLKLKNMQLEFPFFFDLQFVNDIPKV
jgi:hypothetical protein